MSDRHTSIIAPNTDYGMADNGRKTRAEMIARYREHAEVLLKRAQVILATPDDEFIVETYVGRYVKRDLTLIPPPSQPAALTGQAAGACQPLADEQERTLANVIDYLVANGHMSWSGFDDDDEPWSSNNAEFQAILDLVRKALKHRAATSGSELAFTNDGREPDWDAYAAAEAEGATCQPLADEQCDAAIAQALANIAAKLNLHTSEVSTDTKGHWSWGRALIRAGFALAQQAGAPDGSKCPFDGKQCGTENCCANYTASTIGCGGTGKFGDMPCLGCDACPRGVVSAAPLTRCAAGRDGECGHAQCPQLRDGEPRASGRHCPLDSEGGRHD